VEELGEYGLERLVHGLGAADEADRGHAETVLLQAAPGGFDQAVVICQAQVVVGAEVQYMLAARQPDIGRLRAGDDALGFVEAVGADGV